MKEYDLVKKYAIDNELAPEYIRHRFSIYGVKNSQFKRASGYYIIAGIYILRISDHRPNEKGQYDFNINLNQNLGGFMRDLDSIENQLRENLKLINEKWEIK